MNVAFAGFLLIASLWLSGLFCAYAVVLLGGHALLSAFRRHRERKRTSRAAQARIDHDAAMTVHRIGSAFVATQQLIRDEAARTKVGRR